MARRLRGVGCDSRSVAAAAAAAAVVRMRCVVLCVAVWSVLAVTRRASSPSRPCVCVVCFQFGEGGCAPAKVALDSFEGREAGLDMG